MGSGPGCASSPAALDLAAEGRLVQGGWGAVFLLAMAVALAALGVWEWSWRSRGVAPSVNDLDASWSVARDRVGRRSVVLVGTSKMQSALDPRLLGEELGREPAILLALIDSSPLPVLEDLARDEAFAGTVVVDVAPRIFFDGDGGRETGADEVLRAHRSYLVSPGERVDARLGLLVESSLSMRRPAFSLRRLVEWPLTGRAPRTPFARVRLDRFRELDFERLDLDARRRSQARIVERAGRPATAGELDSLVARVATAATTIRQRGGEVVLTMLPVSGQARRAEERRFPRSEYWDRLASSTGLPAIHFADHRRLTAFEAGDGLHLDAESATAFTVAFAELLAPHLR